MITLAECLSNSASRMYSPLPFDVFFIGKFWCSEYPDMLFLPAISIVACYLRLGGDLNIGTCFVPTCTTDRSIPAGSNVTSAYTGTSTVIAS